MVYIVIGQGFEEIEALAPCDILRRGGVEVSLAAIGGKTVSGGQGISVEADCLVEDIDIDKAELIVFPGGSRGVVSIGSSDIAMKAMLDMYEAGKPVAAICAAPTLLGKLGILEGKEAVCYPGLEDQLTGAMPRPDESVVKSGTVVTGRAAGSAVDFGLALLKLLKGEETGELVRKAICYNR